MFTEAFETTAIALVNPTVGISYDESFIVEVFHSTGTINVAISDCR
jgi:hypothetical protein